MEPYIPKMTGNTGYKRFRSSASMCSLPPNPKTPPPPGTAGSKRDAILITISCFFLMMACDSTTDCFGLIFDKLPLQYNISRADAAYVPAFLYSLPMFMGPISSGLVQTFGCRKMLAVGTLVCGASLCLSTLSPNPAVLYLTMGVLAGLGLSLCYMVLDIGINVRFDEKKALVFGIAQCGGMLGTVAFSHLTAFLNENYGWQYSIQFFGAFFLALVITTQSLKGMKKREIWRRHEQNMEIYDNYTDSRPDHYGSNDSFDEEQRPLLSSPINADPRPSRRCSLPQVLPPPPPTLRRQTEREQTLSRRELERRRCSSAPQIRPSLLFGEITLGGMLKRQSLVSLRLLCYVPLVFFLLSRLLLRAYNEAMTLYLPDFAQSELGLSEPDVSYFIMINGIAGLFGATLFSVVMLYLNHSDFAPFLIYGVCNLLAAGALVLVNEFADHLSLCILSGVWGLITAPNWTLESVLLAIILPLQFEDACSLVFIAEGIGCFAGPIIGLHVRDYFGSYRIIFLLAGCCNAGAALCGGLCYLTFRCVSRYRSTPVLFE